MSHKLKKCFPQEAKYTGLETTLKINDLLDEVNSLVDQLDFGYVILKEDKLGHLFETKESCKVAVDYAVKAGKKTAEAVEKQFGTKDPFAVAEKLGIKVVYKTMNPRRTHRLMCSEYDPGLLRPPTIILYNEPITWIKKLIREQRLQKILRIEDPTAVFLAHELFHHIEMEMEEPIIRGFKITTFKWGSVRIEQEVAALSEIAAHSFAKNLLELPFHPKLIDYLIIFIVDDMHGYQLLQKLISNHSAHALNVLGLPFRL
jgi:hypothetical protein